ncbi:MAG: undecaprenyl-diphosphate phosphatase [Neisseriaceae bacterium]
MNFLTVLIVGIVEGLTEYLPVSSTAHMVFTLHLLGIPESSFVKVFIIAIQLGAILAVVVLYWRRFFTLAHYHFYQNLIVAVSPALILGALFNSKIEALLDQPVHIAIVLIVGGIVLLGVDKAFSRPRVLQERDINHKNAFFIGLWQCLAMVPGVSRSAASILGGMQQGLSRTLAAEFSFWLAVPTMCAASAFALFIKKWQFETTVKKGYELIFLSAQHFQLFLLGSFVAFLVALLSIRLLIGLVQRYGFKPWGWYRIIVGSLLLAIFIR